jgi:hypothetical protein
VLRHQVPPGRDRERPAGGDGRRGHSLRARVGSPPRVRLIPLPWPL